MLIGMGLLWGEDENVLKLIVISGTILNTLKAV
jgi:hypothetical protein